MLVVSENLLFPFFFSFSGEHAPGPPRLAWPLGLRIYASCYALLDACEISAKNLIRYWDPD